MSSILPIGSLHFISTENKGNQLQNFEKLKQQTLGVEYFHMGKR